MTHQMQDVNLCGLETLQAIAQPTARSAMDDTARQNRNQCVARIHHPHPLLHLATWKGVRHRQCTVVRAQSFVHSRSKIVTLFRPNGPNFENLVRSPLKVDGGPKKTAHPTLSQKG